MSIGLVTMPANQSLSREVSGNSSSPGLTWAICWLIQCCKNSPMALWIISSLTLRRQTALTQVYHIFGSMDHNKQEMQKHLNWSSISIENVSEWDMSLPLKTVPALFMAAVKTSISPHSVIWIGDVIELWTMLTIHNVSSQLVRGNNANNAYF